MPNLGIVFLVFAATFAGVWYVALPEPIVVHNAQRGYAVEVKAHWAISAKEAESQAALGLSKALERVDDSYGGAEMLYQTRQVIRARSIACLDGTATATGFKVAHKDRCVDRRGDDINPYRRPFAFYKDGTHFSPPAGEAFVAPKQSPKSGAPLIRELPAAVPRLRALDVKLSTGAGSDRAKTWTFQLHGSDWTEVEQAERARREDKAVISNAALLDAPVKEVDAQKGEETTCRTFREAARLQGEQNIPDSMIRYGRACRIKGDATTGAKSELLVITYHKSRQRIRTDDAPAQCASVIRNILTIEQREGRTVPEVAACIGARYHEHDALDVDVNLYEAAPNGQLRYFAN